MKHSTNEKRASCVPRHEGRRRPLPLFRPQMEMKLLRCLHQLLATKTDSPSNEQRPPRIISTPHQIYG